MGLRSAIRDSTSDGSTASREAATRPARSTDTSQDDASAAPRGVDRAEEQFGMEITDRRTLQRLRMHEEIYGERVHEWVDEGMPTEIMGKTRDMEAFRERQADRPPEVPTDIERRNKRSVQRSEQAAETGAAGDAGVPEPVREVIASTGRSLDASIQRAMEDRMGDSLGDVRIHTGPQAAAACESINARAFTVGNHVAFNQGEYDPESPEGQHVLAHELAHVRQQTGGAVSMLPQEDLKLEVDPDPTLEREAEEAAQQAMADGPVVVNRMGCEMHIQRSMKDDTPIVLTEELDDPEEGELEVGKDELKSYLKDGLGPVGAFISKATEMFGDLGHGMQAMDQEDWSEVLIKTGLKIGTAGVASEVLEAGEDVVTETANQARSKAQNKANGGPTLDQLGVSEEWTSILENSPSQWKEQITQEAVKAAKAATGSGDSQGVGKSGEVIN